MKTIALIPARSGSKGIPNKNMIDINGKPLISYTLDLVTKINKFSSIVVSSDSNDIIEYCRNNYHNIEIHIRPSNLASDQSPIKDTINEIIKQSDSSTESLMLLQPTSPLRNEKNILESLDILKNNINFNSLVSVCPMDDVHPARMYWKNKNTLNPIMKEYQHLRRQDIPLAYYRNGSIYLVRKTSFLKDNNILVEPIYGYEMPKSQLLNIDDHSDLKLAKLLLK